jgi:chromosome segregation ATPase
MNIIIDFLEEYREELTLEKMEYLEDNELLISRIRENEKFLQVIQEDEKNYFAEFSPREQNMKNKEKLEEVRLSLEHLQEKREQLNHKINKIENRLMELNQVIAEAKKKPEPADPAEPTEPEIEGITAADNKPPYDLDALSYRLKNIAGYVVSDPYRAKLELQQVLHLLES